VRPRIVLGEWAVVEIGQDDFRSIPVPAARVRLTGSAVQTERMLVRPVLLGMLQVVVMACRIVPGSRAKSWNVSREMGSATPKASR